MKYFVWLPGLRGPEPQLWSSLPTDGGGKTKIEPLFKVEIKVDWDLDECVKHYPLQVISND